MKNQTLHLPHLFRDNLHSQILNEGSGDQKVRSLLQVSQSFGALSGAPAHTTGEGIFSGCFRSSKFTQSSHLSCHKKSLRSDARARSGGGGTCEPWTGGGAPLSSPSPPLRLGRCWRVTRREACEEGAVRVCPPRCPHSSPPSAR